MTYYPDPLTTQSTERGCGTSCLGFALGCLACFILSLLLAGCKGQELVTETIEKPVIVTQEHHTESVRVDIVRDTLIQRDSIFHYVKGDTTIIERWHHVQGQSIITRVDTLHLYDSVPYPVTTTQIKEVTKVEEVNVLRWWQKLLMGIGGLSLVVFALLGAYKIGKK